MILTNSSMGIRGRSNISRLGSQEHMSLHHFPRYLYVTFMPIRMLITADSSMFFYDVTLPPKLGSMHQHFLFQILKDLYETADLI